VDARVGYAEQKWASNQVSGGIKRTLSVFYPRFPNARDLGHPTRISETGYSVSDRIKRTLSSFYPRSPNARDLGHPELVQNRAVKNLVRKPVGVTGHGVLRFHILWQLQRTNLLKVDLFPAIQNDVETVTLDDSLPG